MIRCTNCGAELPDYYTGCPNCGAKVIPAAPVPQAPPMGGYIPMGQQREVTSVLGWLGWTLLCGLLPIIGEIIMLSVTKDPTAKNFAKMMLILNGIAIAIVVLLIGLLFTMVASW